MLLMLSFIVLLLCAYVRKNNIWYSIAQGSLSFLTILYVTTEILSMFRKITRVTVSVSWLIVIILGSIYVLKKGAVSSLKEALRAAKCKILEEKIVMVFLGILMIMLGMSAITITSNWDSMTYHMPRVMYWMQNQSVSYYATRMPRQVYNPPLAEYVIMHVMLLTGNDKFVCLVQGGAYAISALMVYGITKKMNIPKSYRYLATVFFLLMPPAIAQAVTTQNDLFTASILLLFFYYYLEFIYCSRVNHSRETIALAIRLAATIFLGYLAKSNVLITMFCLVVYLAINRIGKKDRLKDLLLIGMVGLLIIGIGISPSLVRNYKVYGQLIPEVLASGVSIKTADIRFLILNCYKNISTYTITSWLPGIYKFHMLVVGLMGNIFNIHINDPAVFSREYELRQGIDMYHHDYAPNFTVMLLLAIIILLLLFKKCAKKTQEMGIFVSIVVAFLWTATMSIWSPWKGRYFLQISSLIIVISCYFLAQVKLIKYNRKIIISILVAVSLVDAGMAFKYTAERVRMGYQERNGRNLGYFLEYEHIDYYNHRDYYQQISQIVEKEKFQNIGLYIKPGEYEYPFWQYIDNIERMEHILVENEYLGKLEDLTFVPECVIMVEELTCEKGMTLEVHGNQYVCIWSSESGRHGIFEKAK